MDNFKQLWRPAAFSAIGDGFSEDSTLNKGIHLRWSFDYRLGLPFEYQKRQAGGFHVFQQIAEPRTLLDLDLLAAELGGAFPIRSSAIPQPGSQMEINGDRLSFRKKTHQGYLKQLWNARVRLRFLRQFFYGLAAEQREYVRYIEWVVNKLHPRMAPSSAAWETSEACAVDVRYTGMNARPSKKPVADDPFVYVQGLDRNDRVIVEDWVGYTAGGGGKAVASLRAPGIAAVRLKNVPGKPAQTIDEVRWMLCEDYCQAPLWPRETPWVTRFNGDPDWHSPETVKNEHYAPFQNPPDADAAAAIIAHRFVADSDVQGMLAEPTTWRAAQWKVRHEGGEDETSMALSMLQSLVGTAVDPVMAKILGTYFFAGETAELFEGRDIKIEARFPFFGDENLDKLEEELRALAPGMSLRFLLDNSRTLAGTRLCGLVLCPRVDQKPLPAMPPELVTKVAVTDIPSQVKPGRTDLLVDAAIEASAPVNDIRPYLIPAGYLVERNRDEKGYEDVISAEETEPDEFDQIRIIPSLYIPRKKRGEWADPLVVKDDFIADASGTSTVQYRLTGYDVFGRPSEPVEGLMEKIVPPCRRPSEPVNLAARIVNEGNFLTMEMTFSLDSAVQALEAAWQKLEVTIHRLPFEGEDSSSGIADTRWSGSIPGRKLEITATQAHDLSFPPVTNSCVALSWIGDQLNRKGAEEAFCSAEIPAATAVLQRFDPPAMPFSETGLRSFRLRMPVGRLTTLAPDVYRWCARLRVKGANPHTGETLYSPEPCIAAERVIPPPPPQPSRPITADIPAATFPDRLGDSYFTLDLNEFQPLATGDLVNVYLTTLDRLTPTPGELVNGNQLLDVAAFQNLAAASRRHFELLTQEPVRYSPQTRFYSIRVRGDLRQYHTAAVVGCNAYLQEQPWTDANFLVFTVAEPVAAPRLVFEETRAYVDNRRPKVALTLSAPATGILAGPTQPPRIQVLRRDLSSGRNALVYVADPAGTLEETAAGEPVYRFRCVDGNVADWHRYEYQATLLVYAAGAGQHLKSGDPAVRIAGAQWGGVRNALDEGGMIIEPPSPEGQNLVLEFSSGEFDFALSKVHETVPVSRIEGQLRDGRLEGLNGHSEGSQLDVIEAGRRYRLVLRDPHTGEGEYTFRLSFGQSVTWSKKGK